MMHVFFLCALNWTGFFTGIGRLTAVVNDQPLICPLGELDAYRVCYTLTLCRVPNARGLIL